MVDRPSHKADNDPRAGTASAPVTSAMARVPTRWSTVRLAMLRGIAVLGALGLIGGFMGGIGALYTSRPQFCRSCHNMEPYYVSWQQSSHHGVSCIKCHFPPGAGEEIRGKLLGLVQLVKYVSATEGPRPAAQVPDASCLRSGCHERRLLTGRIDFRGISFDHRPHLTADCRGKQLRCTSCHTQITQDNHMTVATSTCFLCHFEGQQFNQGLGTCTRCHQIPDAQFDLGGGVTFSHEFVYQRGVDCRNCHGDMIRGTGNVPPERCQVCHNREADLARIGDSPFLHDQHVSEHKIDCLECHLAIDHTADSQRVEHAVTNCSACHVDTHRAQVDMLLGTGAQAIPRQGNPMVTARLTCTSCHQEQRQTSAGAVVWTASKKVCLQCHDQDTMDQRWRAVEQLRGVGDEMSAAVNRARASLAVAVLSAARRRDVRTRLEKIENDLRFLRLANGIHNIHFADTLTRALATRLTAICVELKCVPPNVSLPARTEPDQ